MMQTHASLSGHTFWELLSPSGLVLQRGSHSNLILNSGLDAFSFESSDARPLSQQASAFLLWRHWLDVGTGSTAPDVTQTALTASVGARQANAGAGEGVTYTLEGSSIVLRSTMVRTFNFAAAYNLTEYGLARTVGGLLSVRELFRDAGGVPVVVTVAAGQTLKLTHLLTVTFNFGAVAGVMPVDSGAGPVNVPVIGMYYRPSDFTTFTFDRVIEQFSPTAASALTVFGAQPPSAPDAPGYFAPLAGQYGVTPDTYVSGSYRRVNRYTIGPDSATGPHYGYGLGNGYGWKLQRDGGGVILNKASGQRVELTLTQSWGRA